MLGYKEPILGLTGALPNEDMTDFIDSGANEILSKKNVKIIIKLGKRDQGLMKICENNTKFSFRH